MEKTQMLVQNACLGFAGLLVVPWLGLAWACLALAWPSNNNRPPLAAASLLLLLLDEAKARQARQAQARPSQGTTSKPAKPRPRPAPQGPQGGVFSKPHCYWCSFLAEAKYFVKKVLFSFSVFSGPRQGCHLSSQQQQWWQQPLCLAQQQLWRQQQVWRHQQVWQCACCYA